MEENVNEVLGVSDNTTLETKELEVKKTNNSAENTLVTIANIVLVCGIIATVICLFSIVIIKDPSYNYRTEYMFNPNGFTTTIMVLLSSLISWGFLKVLANISLTLKDINNKIK